MKIVIAGGGTAGHVNPAVALAAQLTEDTVVFVGTARGAEARLVPAAGFDLETIKVSGFDRSKPWSLPVTGIKAMGAVSAAGKVLKRLRPDVVVGMGGYVSLPACLAAFTKRVPTVIHEQNIVLGLANRVCRRPASAVAVSFEDTLDQAGPRGVFTGNPIRRELATADRAGSRRVGMSLFDLDPQRRTLLVFGGSLGADRLNQAALGLAHAWRDRSDVQVLHICGPDRVAGLQAELPGEGALVYRLRGYVDEMAAAYGVADLALCRGGATTVAELCALGVPSIIAPYPHHRDQQQERHGRVLAAASAAVVLPDAATTPESVAELVEPLLASTEALAAMSTAARELGRPDAAAALAEVVRGAAA